jgi:hypothetical protein
MMISIFVAITKYSTLKEPTILFMLVASYWFLIWFDLNPEDGSDMLL